MIRRFQLIKIIVKLLDIPSFIQHLDVYIKAKGNSLAKTISHYLIIPK